MGQAEDLARMQELEDRQRMAELENKAQSFDTPTSEDRPIHLLMRLAEKAIQKGFNLADLERSSTTGPLMAKLLGYENTPDYKDVVSLQKPFPNTETMMQKTHTLDEHPDARFWLGLAGDMAVPSTAMTLGGAALKKAYPAIASKLSMAGDMMNPIAMGYNKGVEKTGKSIWKGAFKGLDLAAEKEGKVVGKNIMPSDVLVEHNVWGPTARSLSRQGAEVSDNLFQQIESLANEGRRPGTSPDLNRIFKQADDYVASLRSVADPEAHALADTFDKKLQAYKDNLIEPSTISSPSKVKDITPRMAIDEKRWNYSKAGPNSYSTNANPNAARQLDMKVAAGLKDETEHLSMNPEKMQNLNEQLGALLSSDEKAAQQVAREETKGLVTPVDAMGVGGLMAAGVNPKWYLGKKIVEAARMPGTKSMVGAGLNKYGKSEILAPMMTRATGRISPWNIYPDQEHGE